MQNQVNLTTFKRNTAIPCINDFKSLNEYDIQDVRKICLKYNTGDHEVL